MRLLVCTGFCWTDEGNGAIASLRGAVDALSRGGCEVEVEAGSAQLRDGRAPPAHGALTARILRRLHHEPFDRLVVQAGGRMALRLIEAGRSAGLKTIYRVGGLYRSSDRTAVREAASRADRVVVPSRFVAQYYRRTWGLSSVAVIAPVEGQPLSPDRPQARELIYVSPCPAKGVEFFSRVAHRLMDRATIPIPIRIIEGRGQLHRVAAIQARAREIDYPLTVTRGVIGIDRVFDRARALMVCSFAEPLGRMASEALAFGVPALVSNRGGLPEVAASPTVCLPLDTGDDADRWVDAIVKLFADQAHYRQLADAAVRRGARLSPEALSSAWRAAMA